MSTLSNEVAGFSCQLSYAYLPIEVREKVKTLLLHGLGVGLAAYNTETVRVALEVGKKQGSGKATILIDGSQVTPAAAAFVNGVILHSRAQEDNYKRGSIHPGVVIIPAALAIGETAYSSGKDIIAALAAGYEIGCRLSRDFCRLSTKRGFRSTPVYGPAAAAITASKLLNLSKEQTMFALGWAANLASGLLQCSIDKTTEMPFQAGLASQHGVMATWLGQAGAMSAKAIYEGEYGFYGAFTEKGSELGPILEGLGEQYVLLETFSKPHPVGGGVQTPTSVMLSLTKENNIDPGEVEQVTIWMHPPEASYPGADSLKPGLVNAKYCTAVACVHRKLTLDTLSQIDHPQVLSLMEKITVIADDNLESMSCKLNIGMKDGRIFSKDAYLTPKDYCFSMEQDAELMRSLIPEMDLPKERIEKIIAMIKNLELCNDIHELMNILVFPGKKIIPNRLPF